MSWANEILDDIAYTRHVMRFFILVLLTKLWYAAYSIHFKRNQYINFDGKGNSEYQQFVPGRILSIIMILN